MQATQPLAWSETWRQLSIPYDGLIWRFLALTLRWCVVSSPRSLHDLSSLSKITESAPLHNSRTFPFLRTITDIRFLTLLKSRMARSSYVISRPLTSIVMVLGVRDWNGETKILTDLLFEPRLMGFQPGPTQSGLYSHRRWLEAWNFEFTVTAKLICAFFFGFAKSRFSHDMAQI